jgi:DNA-binding CsgD family transcriptional regulator
VGNDLISAYTALFQEPGLSVNDLAEQLGRSAEETRGILQQMTELSLIHALDEEQPAVFVKHPALAMQQLISREQDVLAERWRHLEHGYKALSSVMPAFATRHGRPTDEYLPEHLEGLTAVRQRLEELAVRASTEVVSFSPTAANPTNTRAVSRALNLSALRRQVVMKTLYPDSITSEPAAIEFAKELVAAGAEVRITPSLPLRLIIVDREVAVVPLDPTDGTAGALVVRDPGTITAMLALFESYWRTARELSDDQRQTECTPLERAILRQLAMGAKDEAVARQFGLSVRTLRRGIADMMERLQARSRFELGARAALRGWFDSNS